VFRNGALLVDEMVNNFPHIGMLIAVLEKPFPFVDALEIKGVGIWIKRESRKGSHTIRLRPVLEDRCTVISKAGSRKGSSCVYASPASLC
jgi:hypothetical protein